MGYKVFGRVNFTKSVIMEIKVLGMSHCRRNLDAPGLIKSGVGSATRNHILLFRGKTCLTGNDPIQYLALE